MNILFFNDLGGLFHFFAFWSMFFAQITQLMVWWSSGSLLVVFCWTSGSLLLVFCWSSASLLLVCCWSSDSLLVDHQKMNILFFDDLGLFLHFSHRLSLRSLSRSSEVESNPKKNILFFDDLGGLFCFFVFWSTFFAWIARPIIRS